MWTAEAIREAREQIMQCPQTLGNVRDFALMSIALDALDKECEGGEVITMEQAQAWVDRMDNADTSRPHGGRWTYAEATELGHKLGVPDDQMIAFFVALNMIWSDYGPVISAAGNNTPDFYGKMARAFIDDKDARPHKVARYMRAIAK
jgi:hypothetical protein